MENQKSSPAQLFQEDFGHLIRLQRKHMGLNQINAAEAIGIDYRHYQNIEGGKIDLRLSMMMKICKFYGIEFTANIPEPIKPITSDQLPQGGPA